GNYGYFSSKSRTTSGLNTISTNKVRKAKIPLPPVSMQKKFAEIYKTIEQLRDHQTQSHQHIDNLFNALMQQAFRGKLS
ncbi:MAG: type I restriction enzyme, S subunit, partial [Candidatus Methanocomedens sp.]